MTLEEAIKQLEINKKDDTYVIDAEAIDMAIKALEQEPCEEAISRQAVMDEIEFTPFDDYSDYLMIREKIEALPPVKPQEPKTGHWVKHDASHSMYYDCSLCGCVAPCTETADKILWKMANYCPDCGARMESEE